MGSLLDLFYDFLVCAAKLEQSLQAHRQPFLLLLVMEPTPLMLCGVTPQLTDPSLEISSVSRLQRLTVTGTASTFVLHCNGFDDKLVGK